MISKEALLSNPTARDFYEERAAIREYDGGYDRKRAEQLALFETGQKFIGKGNP